MNLMSVRGKVPDAAWTICLPNIVCLGILWGGVSMSPLGTSTPLMSVRGRYTSMSMKHLLE
jgi:hypothetical protein